MHCLPALCVGTAYGTAYRYCLPVLAPPACRTTCMAGCSPRTWLPIRTAGQPLRAGCWPHLPTAGWPRHRRRHTHRPPWLSCRQPCCRGRPPLPHPQLLPRRCLRECQRQQPRRCLTAVGARLCRHRRLCCSRTCKCPSLLPPLLVSRRGRSRQSRQRRRPASCRPRPQPLPAAAAGAPAAAPAALAL